jgi:hypothetical protein
MGEKQKAIGNRDSGIGIREAEKHARHPGRAAALSGAAQVRDLSHQVRCLPRSTARRAALRTG